MENLAGRKDCDGSIQRELLRARIEAVKGERVTREVPYSVTGRLVVKATGAEIILTRAWYYWVAIGLVPLDLAQRLYADPVGVVDVRVAGHCGCPPPQEWVEWVGGKPFIGCYHIDTEVGLRLFADVLAEKGGGNG